MKSGPRAIFPSFIYEGMVGQAKVINLKLEKEIGVRLRPYMNNAGKPDGRSSTGYTTFYDDKRMHKTSRSVAMLCKKLRPHVDRYVRSLNWDLLGGKLILSSCWANAMKFGTAHSMHIHQHSAISGVYYVTVPPGSSPLVLEDPRASLFMAAPIRSARAPLDRQPLIPIQPKPGKFILFESWMRHEVPPQEIDEARLSIAFNYDYIAK